MYPRVKVRQDLRDDCDCVQERRRSPRSPLLGLKALDFLSIHDYDSPEPQHRVVFAECVVRIPDGHVSAVRTADSASEGRKKETRADENNKSNIRASLVPRPRAVLSSPDNDAVIGKKNRKVTERSSALRNHNTLKAKEEQSKSICRGKTDEVPISRKKTMETAETTPASLEEPVKAPLSQRTNLRPQRRETKHCLRI